MCNLRWTPQLLEKDNSKINHEYNTKKDECSQYRKKKISRQHRRNDACNVDSPRPVCAVRRVASRCLRSPDATSPGCRFEHPLPHSTCRDVEIEIRVNVIVVLAQHLGLRL